MQSGCKTKILVVTSDKFFGDALRESIETNTSILVEVIKAKDFISSKADFVFNLNQIILIDLDSFDDVTREAVVNSIPTSKVLVIGFTDLERKNFNGMLRHKMLLCGTDYIFITILSILNSISANLTHLLFLDTMRRSDGNFYEAVANLPNHLYLVFEKMAEALPNKEIARVLCLSNSTVRTYASTILSRTGCSSRCELVFKAANMKKRKISQAAGLAALAEFNKHAGATAQQDLATAVRYTLEELAARAPGGAVEVRIPPYGATQCLDGGQHRRGTPPNVVETDPHTWLALVLGRLSWCDAHVAGKLSASGARADLTSVLPLYGQDFALGLS